MWNVRKEQGLHFLHRITEKKNGKEVNVVSVANKMNVFTINFGHTGKWHDCKEKMKVYFNKEWLRMLDKALENVVTVRTGKSLNTLNSCFVPNFSFTKSFECNTKKGRQQTKLEMKILPFPWTLKKALGRLKDVLPSQIHHCPPSNLTSVLLISQHSPDTHSPPKHSKKCNLKAYQRHLSLLVYWLALLDAAVSEASISKQRWGVLGSLGRTKKLREKCIWEERNVSSYYYFLCQHPNCLGYIDCDIASFNRNRDGKTKIHV